MNDREIEIRIADLFAAVLKALRPILCLALVLALLAGGFGLYKTQRMERTDTGEIRAVLKAETALEDAEARAALAENALERHKETEIPIAENKIEQAQKNVEQRQKYIDESLFQALDAFNCGISSLTLFTESEQSVDPAAPWTVTDASAVVANAFSQMLANDDEILDQVRLTMKSDAEARFIREMVSVSNLSNQLVEIRVYNQDAQVAERVAQALYDAFTARMEESMQGFSVRIIGRSTGYDVDQSVNDRQIRNENALLSAKSALYEAQNQLQLLSDEYSEKEKAAKSAEDDSKAAAKALKDLRMKTEHPFALYALIGLAVGLALGCCAALVGAALSSRLQNQSAVRSRYAFPILGILPGEKKRILSRAIRKLEGDPETDGESAARVAAQNVLDLASGKKICLISSLGSAAAERFAPYLGGALPVCGDILRDPAAAKALAEFDGAVLVEKREKSRFDQVDGEMQQLKMLGKDILGIVLY